MMAENGATSKSALRKLFYSMASRYCQLNSENFAAMMAQYGVMMPYWMINGAYRMMDEFQDAFKCKAGDRMARPLTCKPHMFG